MHRLLLLVLSLGTSMVARAAAPLPPVEPQIVPLWRDGSPNNPKDGSRPTLEIYRPFPPTRTLPTTIVIMPGGGYGLISPYERLFADFFRSLGYAAVVVNYRLAPNHYPAQYADALRAMRLVRENGPQWGLPIGRVALLGGSAGGHLTSVITTQPDYSRDPEDDLAGKVSARPDRLILLYPAISSVAPYKHSSLKTFFGPNAPDSLWADLSPERHVTKDCPPVIIFHAADDPNVTVQNSVDFAQACWKAGVDCELHVFPHGGHGRTFAYDPENSPRWRELLIQWLANWKE